MASTNSKRKLIRLGVLYASLPLFFLLTNPQEIPLPLLILPFVLLYLSLYFSVKLVLERFSRQQQFKLRSSIAATLAGLPVMLVVLQSTGQLSVSDLLIVLGLMVGTVFYFRKAGFL